MIPKRYYMIPKTYYLFGIMMLGAQLSTSETHAKVELILTYR